jgi:septation ring formation regulator EzrA
MNKKKHAMVRQFKNELKARLDYQTRITELENKILLLDAQFEVKSPALSDIRYSQESRDARLAAYITRKKKYEDELNILQKQAEKVDEIASRMNPTVYTHLRNVYKGHYTLEEAGSRMGLSRAQFKLLVDEEIRKALDF